jgi:hypothetical protein
MTAIPKREYRGGRNDKFTASDSMPQHVWALLFKRVRR